MTHGPIRSPAIHLPWMLGRARRPEPANWLPALAASALLTVGCGPQVSTLAAAAQADSYVVTAPVVADVAEKTAHVAEVRALRHVEIKARHGGRVERVDIDEGGTVAAGQLLFVLGAREARIDVQRAEAQRQVAAAEMRTAEIELRNRKALVAKDVVSLPEVEMAEAGLAAATAKLAEANAAVAAAELSLEYAEVRAPFAGAVNRLPFRVGSQVEAGTTLTTLSDSSEVFAYFRISEREYLATPGLGMQGAAATADQGMTAGQGMLNQVEFVRADGAPLAPGGRIDAVESVINSSTGAVTCRARFPNPGGVLKHGATGKVVITHLRQGGIVVPQRATFERQQDVCVYVVSDDGTVATRRIVPELRLADHYVVQSGVTPGERVLLEGARSVRDGARITPVFKAMQEVAPL
jgi:membrane fusion protein, multidrug efflux system